MLPHQFSLAVPHTLDLCLCLLQAHSQRICIIKLASSNHIIVYAVTLITVSHAQCMLETSGSVLLERFVGLMRWTAKSSSSTRCQRWVAAGVSAAERFQSAGKCMGCCQCVMVPIDVLGSSLCRGAAAGQGGVWSIYHQVKPAESSFAPCHAVLTGDLHHDCRASDTFYCSLHALMCTGVHN